MRANGRDLLGSKLMTAEDLRGRDLGTCCICGTVEGVHEVVPLDGRCPLIGRGWGCRICGLPPHGAVAVLCRSCLQGYAIGQMSLRWICTGVPWLDGRTPFCAMQGTYQHDASKHPREEGGTKDGT